MRAARVIPLLGSGLTSFAPGVWIYRRTDSVLLLAIALLFFSGLLAPWNVYPCTAVMSGSVTLQWPAWSAATTLLVPKEHLGRASGMVQSVDALATLAAPAIAGALYARVGVGALVLADVLSYCAAGPGHRPADRPARAPHHPHVRRRVPRAPHPPPRGRDSRRDARSCCPGAGLDAAR